MNVSAKEEELFEGRVYLQEPQLNYIINYIIRLKHCMQVKENYY